jgi:hypothetical protein
MTKKKKQWFQLFLGSLIEIEKEITTNRHSGQVGWALGNRRPTSAFLTRKGTVDKLKTNN